MAKYSYEFKKKRSSPTTKVGLDPYFLISWQTRMLIMK